MSRPTRERKPMSYAEDPIEDSDLDDRENAAQRMPIIKFAEQRNTRTAVPVQKKLLRCKANPGATNAEADLAAQALGRPARSTVAPKSYRWAMLAQSVGQHHQSSKGCLMEFYTDNISRIPWVVVHALAAVHPCLHPAPCWCACGHAQHAARSVTPPNLVFPTS